MKKTALFLGLLLSSNSIYAGGVYFGVGLGSTTADDAKGNVDKVKQELTQAGATGEVTYLVRTMATSVALGYHVNSNIDVELGYDYLGTYDLDATIKMSGATFRGTERNKVSAASLSTIFSANLSDNVSVHARIGLANTTNKSTCQTNFTATCNGDSDSNTGALFGLGGAFKMSGNSALRLDYIEFNDVGDKNNEYTAGTFSTVKLSYIYTP